MRRQRLAAGALALALAVAGCGGDDASERPEGRTDADVIRDWADAVRAQDFDAANALFSVPATIANVGPKVRVSRRAGIDNFNRSLPCGAKLIATQEANGGYTRATFELVDGTQPCEGEASVSFRIEDEHITEWLREGAAPPPSNTTET